MNVTKRRLLIAGFSLLLGGGGYFVVQKKMEEGRLTRARERWEDLRNEEKQEGIELDYLKNVQGYEVFDESLLADLWVAERLWGDKPFSSPCDVFPEWGYWKSAGPSSYVDAWREQLSLPAKMSDGEVLKKALEAVQPFNDELDVFVEKIEGAKYVGWLSAPDLAPLPQTQRIEFWMKILGQLRYANGFLVGRSELRMRSGLSDLGMRDLRASLRLTEMEWQSSTTLLHCSLSLAELIRAQTVVRGLINDKLLSKQQSLELMQEVNRWDVFEVIQQSIAGEAYSILHILREDRETDEDWKGLSETEFLEIRNTLQTFITKTILPLKSAPAGVTSLLKLQAELDKGAATLHKEDAAAAVHIFTAQGMMYLVEQALFQKVYQDITRIGFACYLYELDYGSYPLNLKELVPSYLPSLPVHPETGDAYQYRHAADSGFPEIYTEVKGEKVFW